MKKIIFVFFFISISTFSFSQKDSAQTVPKQFFGFSLRAGMQQMNFSTLRNIPYLLNQPPDISIKSEVGFLYGIRAKFLVSAYYGYSGLPAALSLNLEKTGTYNNYIVHSRGSYRYWGASFFYNAFPKKKSNFFHAIYPNIGFQFVDSQIYSKEDRRTMQNADTTVFLEEGHVKSYLVNFGVLIELPKLLKKTIDDYSCRAVTISFGYTLQIQDPKWTYSTPPMNLSDPRKINQGGFYVTIGWNNWFYKGMFKRK